MIGPCLCGDPYCPSCGDPSAAAFEGLIENIADFLSSKDDIEIRLFVAAGRAALDAYAEACAQANDRATSEGNWMPDFTSIFD